MRGRGRGNDAGRNRSDNRVISGGFRGKVFGNKCNVNKSNRGKDGEMEMWREKEGKVKEIGEREREGESGGTAEVDTNEEPL